ncbi:MAG: hypothetical protein ACYC1C_18010 [Chloroflexota bacterium]
MVRDFGLLVGSAALGLPMAFLVTTLLLGAFGWSASAGGLKTRLLLSKSLWLALLSQGAVVVAVFISDGSTFWSLALTCLSIAAVTWLFARGTLGEAPPRSALMAGLAAAVLGVWAVVSLPIWMVAVSSEEFRQIVVAVSNGLRELSKVVQRPTPTR